MIVCMDTFASGNCSTNTLKIAELPLNLKFTNFSFQHYTIPLYGMDYTRFKKLRKKKIPSKKKVTNRNPWIRRTGSELNVNFLKLEHGGSLSQRVSSASISTAIFVVI